MNLPNPCDRTSNRVEPLKNLRTGRVLGVRPEIHTSLQEGKKVRFRLPSRNLLTFQYKSMLELQHKAGMGLKWKHMTRLKPSRPSFTKIYQNLPNMTKKVRFCLPSRYLLTFQYKVMLELQHRAGMVLKWKHMTKVKPSCPRFTKIYQYLPKFIKFYQIWPRR